MINLQKDGQQELAAVTNSTVVELGNTVDTERGAFMDTAAIMPHWWTAIDSPIEMHEIRIGRCESVLCHPISVSTQSGISYVAC